MLLPLHPILLLAPDPVEAAITRHQRYMRSMQSSSATFTYKFFPGTFGGNGRVILQRPNRLRFEVSVPGGTYVCITNSAGIVEYSTATKSYLEFGGTNKWYRPPGELMDVSLLFPTPMIVDNLGAWMRNWKLAGQNGSTTTISAILQSPTGNIKYSVTIDASGRPSKYTAAAADGSKGVTHTITQVSANSALASTLFEPLPPLGYSAAKLPYLPPVMGREGTFPLDGWKTSNGESIRLNQWSGQKTTLIAVVQRSCPRSNDLIQALSKNRKQLEKLGLRMAGVDLGSNSSWIKGIPTLTTTQKNLDTLNVDGTPYLYMVTPTGKIWGMWQGFDPNKVGAMMKEIEVAYKAQGNY